MDPENNSNQALKVVFAGSPAFALPSLEALLACEWIDLCWVVTQPDKPAGRGLKTQSSAVKHWCTDRGVEVVQPRRLDQDFADKIKSEAVDWLVVAAYGQMIPQVVLDAPKMACLNIHASLLPRWRGASPIEAAILAEDETTGVCLMQMVLAMDEGPVLSSATLTIGDKTAGEAREKLALLGATLLIDGLSQSKDLLTWAVPQEESLATYCYRIKKSHTQVLWSVHEAKTVVRMLKAYADGFGCFTWLQGSRVKLFDGCGVQEHDLLPMQGAKPGSILDVTDHGLWVKCAQGVVNFSVVQLSGGKKFEFIPAKPVPEGLLKLKGCVFDE